MARPPAEFWPWRATGAGPSRSATPKTPTRSRRRPRPRIVCNIKGARIVSSIDGWAQANMSARRRSGIDASSPAAASSSSAISASASEDASALRRRREASIMRRRAVLASQPAGLAGTPCAGQTVSAAAKASASASSAPGTSRLGEPRDRPRACRSSRARRGPPPIEPRPPDSVDEGAPRSAMDWAKRPCEPARPQPYRRRKLSLSCQADRPALPSPIHSFQSLRRQKVSLLAASFLRAGRATSLARHSPPLPACRIP